MMIMRCPLSFLFIGILALGGVSAGHPNSKTKNRIGRYDVSSVALSSSHSDSSLHARSKHEVHCDLVADNVPLIFAGATCYPGLRAARGYICYGVKPSSPFATFSERRSCAANQFCKQKQMEVYLPDGRGREILTTVNGADCVDRPMANGFQLGVQVDGQPRAWVYEMADNDDDSWTILFRAGDRMAKEKRRSTTAIRRRDKMLKMSSIIIQLQDWQNKTIASTTCNNCAFADFELVPNTFRVLIDARGAPAVANGSLSADWDLIPSSSRKRSLHS